MGERLLLRHIHIARQPPRCIRNQSDHLDMMVMAICAEIFTHHPLVCRLRCRHIVYAQCWQLMHNGRHNAIGMARAVLETPSSPGLECPNCRVSGHMIVQWTYLEYQVTQSGAPMILPGWRQHSLRPLGHTARRELAQCCQPSFIRLVGIRPPLRCRS